MVRKMGDIGQMVMTEGEKFIHLLSENFIQIILIGVLFVIFQRYHASNDGKYSGNDGRYVHQENKYVRTKDQTSGTGSASVRFGADNIVVNIGQRTTQSPPPTPPITTTELPQPRSDYSPSPPFLIIDTGSNAVANNHDDSSPAELIKILRQEQEETADGYHYVYETENGIVVEESGQIEKTETGEDALRTTGFYQYIGDDGKQYRVDYVADVNGFVAKGDHIPTPGPEIQELLNNLATQEYGPQPNSDT